MGGNASINRGFQCSLIILIDSDARRTDKFVQRTLNNSREIRIQTDLLIGIVGQGIHMIVTGINKQTAEEVRPSEVIQRFLFRRDRSADDLSIHVIGEDIEKTRFH